METADVVAITAAATMTKLSARFRKAKVNLLFRALSPRPVPVAAFPLFTFAATDKESEVTSGGATGTVPTATKKVFFLPAAQVSRERP